MKLHLLKSSAIALLGFSTITLASTSISQQRQASPATSTDASRTQQSPFTSTHTTGTRAEPSQTPWLAPFLPALGDVFALESYDDCNNHNTSTSDTLHELDLRSEAEALARRQLCANGYSPCRAAGFCCANNTICQTDQNGQVACCPQGAKCTGVVPISSATATRGGATGAGIATTTQPPQNGASVGANGGQIVAGSSTVAFIAGTNGAEHIIPGGFVAELLQWLV